MAQVLPLNECEDNVLGYALNRAQLMERGLIPFKTATVYDGAQITFQKIGPRVRAFIQSPDWFGPGYRQAIASNAYESEHALKGFKQYEPTGTTGTGFDRARTLVSSSLYERSYALLTELFQTYEEEFFMNGTKKYSLRFVVKGQVLHEETLMPKVDNTNLVAIGKNDIHPADAAMEFKKSFEVLPIESFGLYPAVLVTTKVSHLSSVLLPPSPRSMDGNVILTATSLDGSPVKTISGRVQESFPIDYYHDGASGYVWDGTAIPWIEVPGGEDGSVSAIIATFGQDGETTDLPIDEFGSTKNEDRTAVAMATTHALKYVAAVDVEGTPRYEVRVHGLVTGKTSARVLNQIGEPEFEYQWKNAPVEGVLPAAVVRPDGHVFAAYLCMTGTSKVMPPPGIPMTVRLAGAVESGVFDVELPIKGSTLQSDIVRLRLITATQPSGDEGLGSAHVFLAYDIRSGSQVTYHVAGIRVSGLQPTVVGHTQLVAAIPEGVSVVSGGTLITVGGTKVSGTSLSEGTTQSATLPAAAVAFRCSSNAVQILTTADKLSVSFGGGALSQPSAVPAGAVTTTGYLVGKNMAKVKYSAPAAGKEVDESPYAFLLKPFKYTKVDDPSVPYGFTSYQWEQGNISTRVAPYSSNVQVGMSAVYSDYPWLVDTRFAYKFGIVASPSYSVTSVPIPGGSVGIVTQDPVDLGLQDLLNSMQIAIAVNAFIAGVRIDNRNFDKMNYRPPLFEEWGNEITHVTATLVNEFATVYPGITSHHWTPIIDTTELVAWMQS